MDKLPLGRHATDTDETEIEVARLEDWASMWRGIAKDHEVIMKSLLQSNENLRRENEELKKQLQDAPKSHPAY
jgi:regulator of replication initiation timing